MFDQSKSEKKHAWKLILGAKESVWSLTLQAVDAPFVEALKEVYIRYVGQTPFELIVHLRTKISKVTNKDKLQLKREVFIAWDLFYIL